MRCLPWPSYSPYLGKQLDWRQIFTSPRGANPLCWFKYGHHFRTTVSQAVSFSNQIFGPTSNHYSSKKEWLSTTCRQNSGKAQWLEREKSESCWETHFGPVGSNTSSYLFLVSTKASESYVGRDWQQTKAISLGRHKKVNWWKVQSQLDKDGKIKEEWRLRCSTPEKICVSTPLTMVVASLEAG